MDVESSKTANKRIRTNWTNEEVATLLGVWESHTNKQGDIDRSIKMMRLRVLANCPSKCKTTPMSHLRIIIQTWMDLSSPTHPIHIFLETYHSHGQNTEIITKTKKKKKKLYLTPNVQYITYQMQNWIISNIHTYILFTYICTYMHIHLYIYMHHQYKKQYNVNILWGR